MPTRRDFLASVTAAFATGGLHPVASADFDTLVTGASDPNLTVFDDLLTKFLKENAIPGAAVAITRSGKLVYARGFGYADIEKKAAVEPDALFRIASVSKPITAVGVLQLVDAGKVMLDDPAVKYFTLKPFLTADAKPDERWEKITIRQCLQHTGGWDRGKKGGFDPISIPGRITRAMKLAGAPTPDDIVRYMMGQPLDFDPGEKMVYSNLGYLVLGRVIEPVTGQKYEPWVKKNVLAPVGAARMLLGKGLPENRVKGEVKYYDSKKRIGTCLYPPKTGQQVPLPDGANNIEGYEAHGGWVASAVDLVRFASAFDNDKKSPLLSATAIKEMWARPAGAAGFDQKDKPKASYYGCGWSVRPVGAAGKANAWHNGLIPGTSTLLVRRNDGLNWAVLFNTEANADGKVLSNLIDSPMHDAATAVKKWPSSDLFEKFLPGT
jgi:CubicO group peptidase (beta-lactamase class C family)